MLQERKMQCSAVLHCTTARVKCTCHVRTYVEQGPSLANLPAAVRHADKARLDKPRLAAAAATVWARDRTFAPPQISAAGQPKKTLIADIG